MQTVPSLVGTGTAIAAAATGLVFGQPSEPDSSSSLSSTNRRRTHQRHHSTDVEPPYHPRIAHLISPRPATSAVPAPDASESYYTTIPRPPSSSRPPISRYQRPLSRQFSPLKLSSSRRSSCVNQGDPSTPTILEAPKKEKRDSVSSNGSWIRRLSLRPLSHHESSRSSVCPDSPSITFSHGSTAPILSPTGSAAPQLPPNKLVKRAPPGYQNDGNVAPRRRAKSHLPPLRRPATSHQRSATMQQLNPPSDVMTPISLQNFTFDQEPSAREYLTPSPLDPIEPPTPAPAPPTTRPAWISFFHIRRASLTGRPGPSRLNELKPVSRSASGKRIYLGFNEKPRVHLVKPRMVSSASAPPVLSSPTYIKEEPERFMQPTESPEPADDPNRPRPFDGREEEGEQQEEEEEKEKEKEKEEAGPPKKAKRSLSLTLTSASNLMSRTAGSLRRPKRGADPDGGNKRHVSELISGSQPGADLGANTPVELSLAQEKQGSALDSAANAHLRTRKRNSSSPLPPLSRLSSFSVDISRLGSTSGVSAHQVRQNQPSGSSTSSTGVLQFRAAHYERSSTMESSSGDTRDCTSGDDDDTDFKSDTMFDSLRTVGSNRARAVETPLDSMYDESPPSTAGNSRTKRLSIQEMLGKSWDEGENRIMEEDENMPTPVRNAQRAETHYPSREMRSSPRFSLEYSPHDISPTAREFHHPSFEDDFDDDWTRDDDDAPYNPLSPPSKGSSLNSRGINPNVRLALASISGNSLLDVSAPLGTPMSERPLSTLFDWSEPPIHDKADSGDGRSVRPKTSYVMPETDTRGGRPPHRKGPAPLHVRSQSVPVVHGFPEPSRTNGAKYGTWGMASKPVSEDWDDDFEFGGSNFGNEDMDAVKTFAVPESIRATQPSVKAHSGQIRELSLLVNDLKRLCRHGRDMDMLDGSSRSLWKEAEGIIALASPDEDSDDPDEDSASSSNFDPFDSDDRLGDSGLDACSLERLDGALGDHGPAMSKTAVVRERHSPRRRSVFSPEDDIFGNFQLCDSNIPSSRSSRPRTPESRPNNSNDVNGVVRSVMEAMQQRNVAEPVHDASHNKSAKMHFDTNSLKALVKRAGDLRDLLSDLVRRADQITSSPMGTPRHERQLDSSPAFIKVFDDPGSSPPRRMPRSRGSASIMDRTSPDRSPSSGLPQRMQMMTVS